MARANADAVGPSVERKWDFAAIGSLADALAALYDTETDARRVIADAQLDDMKSDIEFRGASLVVWFGILRIARLRPGAIEKIIGVAVDAYPDDNRLAAAVATDVAPAPKGAASKLLPQVAEVPPPARDEQPLVDRTELVAFLEAELHQANATGAGRALLLIGDQGVGKTRLADCAVCAARGLGALVLEARCIGTDAEALLPLRDSLLSYTGEPTIEEILGDSPTRSRQYLPFLRSFLRIDTTGTSGPQLGGSSDQGVYAGLAEVLLGLASPHGLCLVVDDLTDADQDTLHFLDYFRRKAEQSRILTISTVKLDLLEPELRDVIDKWEIDGCQVSQVQPLEPADAKKLVAQMWVGTPLGEGEVQQIVELTGGNPFFIEQYVGLRLDDRSFDAEAEVPRRIEAVLRRRLRRLDTDSRRFLEAAAIALEASDRLELIRQLAGVDEIRAQSLLRSLVEARCLVEDGRGSIAFIQEPLRRVVEDDLGPHGQQAMHIRAGEWLEREGLLAAAVHHYRSAGRNEDLIRAALAGGERAEHAGLYRTAVQLYEQAEHVGDLQIIAPRLAKAYLVVGEWSKAEALLDRLPADEPALRLLRSELHFDRGEFARSREEIELVLQAPSADRWETLVRLADINLYLGDFANAAKSAHDALEEARSTTQTARCKGILGAVEFFGGAVDEGERLFIEAMTMLSSQPLEERDPVVYTTILENLGSVSEARGEWDAAKQFHEEALAKRREVSDARGVLQSLHALARSDLALGELDAAVQSLEEARVMACDLGDQLEQGKIEHTSVDVELRRGLPANAVHCAEAALRQFRRASTAYDVAHARFSLSRAFAAAGERRRAIEEGAKARVEMERNGYGLLTRLVPELAFSYPERIEAGLLAYSCGDAVGLPWEGRPAAEIDAARIMALPAAAQWPRGATSDDTALTLLVASSLVGLRRADGARFLAELTERAPGIKGLGPSTTEAIKAFRDAQRPPAAGGNTNGALMRSLPIGWALPLDRFEDRREWTLELSRATHRGPDACCAALVGAACAAWAIEGAQPALLVELATAEAAAVAPECGADGRIAELLAMVAAGEWRPDPASLGPDAYETLLRSLWCMLEQPSLSDALVAAVRLGGDTDTVAALVGGLLGCGRTADEVRAELPWSSEIQAPDDAAIASLAVGLSDLRTARSRG